MQKSLAMETEKKNKMEIYYVSAINQECSKDL